MTDIAQRARVPLTRVVFTETERRIYTRWLKKKRQAEGVILPTSATGKPNLSGIRLKGEEATTLWNWVRRKRLARGETFPSLPGENFEQLGNILAPQVSSKATVPPQAAPAVSHPVTEMHGELSECVHSSLPVSAAASLPDYRKLLQLREKFFGIKAEKRQRAKPDPVADLLKERWRNSRDLGRGPKRMRHGSREQKYTYIERTYAVGWKAIEKDLLTNPEDPKVLKHFANILDAACHRLKREGCPEAVLPDKMRSEWAIVCTWLLFRNTQPGEVYARIKTEGGTEKIRRQAAKIQKYKASKS